MIDSVLKAVALGFVAAIGGVIVAIIGILAIFLFAMLGALMGAITGWIVQVVPVLGPLVKSGFMAIGVQNPDLVAIGAMLGFVGGFFKASSGSHGCKCD